MMGEERQSYQDVNTLLHSNGFILIPSTTTWDYPNYYHSPSIATPTIDPNASLSDILLSIIDRSFMQEISRNNDPTVWNHPPLLRDYLQMLAFRAMLLAMGRGKEGKQKNLTRRACFNTIRKQVCNTFQVEYLKKHSIIIGCDKFVALLSGATISPLLASGALSRRMRGLLTLGDYVALDDKLGKGNLSFRGGSTGAQMYTWLKDSNGMYLPYICGLYPAISTQSVDTWKWAIDLMGRTDHRPTIVGHIPTISRHIIHYLTLEKQPFITEGGTSFTSWGHFVDDAIVKPVRHAGQYKAVYHESMHLTLICYREKDTKDCILGNIVTPIQKGVNTSDTPPLFDTYQSIGSINDAYNREVGEHWWPWKSRYPPNQLNNTFLDVLFFNTYVIWKALRPVDSKPHIAYKDALRVLALELFSHTTKRPINPQPQDDHFIEKDIMTQ